MNNQLLECIPNFSEGRTKAVIEKIINSMASITGVKILDQHSDPDHNRTVVTLIGPPERVSEAAFQGIQKASELIDMTIHTGAHPRIGAADVVPFVPIQNMSMDESVEIARKLGERVAKELGIPVYLYESAATNPERVNLEFIRKGEFEGLKTEIETNPARKPDFGPSKLGKAGAVVIGARPPLIAFNVYLDTDDVQIAKKIARAIRYSSGGLRYVKAMGVLVDGLAQVSMNLTNFRKTSLPFVIETIRQEAYIYKTDIHHSELVGLIPQDALIDTAVWYSQLDQFSNNQILENKLAEGKSETQVDFLDRLASRDPTPGGGSAAAYTAAESAALISMVCGLTLGKKKYATNWVEMGEVLNKSEELRAELTALVERDSKSYKKVMAAYQLLKTNDSEKKNREKSIQKALLDAARVPLETVQKCRDLLKMAFNILEKCNVNAITDLAAAAQFAFTAASVAGANARINIKGFERNAEAEDIARDLEITEKDIKEMDIKFRRSFSNMSGIDLL